MVSKALNIGLRALQFFCALIVISLTGNMVATAIRGNPAMINYDIFVSIFGMLSLLYLIPTAVILDSYSFPVVDIALDALNVIFWFCGAVATAAYLGVHSCSNPGYTTTNHITNGSHDTKKRCHEAQASTAFLWFGWAAFTASLVFSMLAGRGNVNMRSVTSSRPAMSQA